MQDTGLASEVHSCRIAPPARDWRGAAFIGLMIAAAALRLVALPAAPPGLNQDEAANAWNAWCLLQTGHDQAGTPWPLFWTHALGENRSTLYLYTLLPFQALGGLNVWTTRLPAAIAGVLTVALIAWIAARLFDRTTGLVAAGLAAFAPWYIDLSRWGHEASLGPLLSALSLAAMLWAGLLPGERQGPQDTAQREGSQDAAPDSHRAPIAHRLRWWRAALAGLLAGIACYGYPAVRIYLPLLIGATLVFSGAAGNLWDDLLNRRLIRSRRGLLALAAFGVAFAATFGPLLFQHFAHPDVIARRAGSVWLWEPGEPLAAKAAKVAARYAAHFGPGALTFTGLDDQQRGPLGFGAFSWYVLPLLIAGLLFTLPRLRRSAAARLLLVGLLLYPAGDCLHRYSFETAAGVVDLGPHILRSGPGLWALVILAAVGAVELARRLRSRRPAAAAWVVPAAVARWVVPAAVAAALVSELLFLAFFFGSYRRRPAVRRDYHADLVEALHWARPRVRSADAVFITATGMNMPYVVTLVATGYDPQEWFQAPRDVRTFSESEFEYVFRVGRLHFLYDDSTSRAALGELRQNDEPDHVLFIVRPAETPLRNPIHTVTDPSGQPALAIFELTL